MLKNKLILFLIILTLLFSACSNDLTYEGRIKNIDSTLSNGMKSISSITLHNNNNEQKFYIKSGKKLEDINIDFTYSHIKSHMHEGEKVKIKYDILNSKHMIIDFEFLDHSH